MEPILEIHNLSKKFRINHELGPYMTFRERLLNLTKSRKGSTSEDFLSCIKEIMKCKTVAQ